MSIACLPHNTAANAINFINTRQSFYDAMGGAGAGADGDDGDDDGDVMVMRLTPTATRHAPRKVDHDRRTSG